MSQQGTRREHTLKFNNYFLCFKFEIRKHRKQIGLQIFSFSYFMNVHFPHNSSYQWLVNEVDLTTPPNNFFQKNEIKIRKQKNGFIPLFYPILF